MLKELGAASTETPYWYSLLYIGCFYLIIFYHSQASMIIQEVNKKILLTLLFSYSIMLDWVHP